MRSKKYIFIVSLLLILATVLSFRTLFDDITGMIDDGIAGGKCKESDGRAC